MTEHIPEATLNTEAAARYVGVAPITLKRLRGKTGGPRFVQLSERSIRYRRAALDAWLLERERTSNHDQAEAEVE